MDTSVSSVGLDTLSIHCITVQELRSVDAGLVGSE